MGSLWKNDPDCLDSALEDFKSSLKARDCKDHDFSLMDLSISEIGDHKDKESLLSSDFFLAFLVCFLHWLTK